MQHKNNLFQQLSLYISFNGHRTEIKSKYFKSKHEYKYYNHYQYNYHPNNIHIYSYAMSAIYANNIDRNTDSEQSDNKHKLNMYQTIIMINTLILYQKTKKKL